MFHRILVGVDDSPASRAALERAIELVDAGHGRLGLLSSAPSPPPLASRGPVVMPFSRAELDAAADRMGPAQRRGGRQARAAGDPGDEDRLPRLALAGRCCARPAPGCWDLVIVGQSHRARPLLDRVGERLNRRSPMPVLVVHEEPREPRPARAGDGATAHSGPHRLSRRDNPRVADTLVFIPAWNEEDSLPAVLADAHRDCPTSTCS